MIRRTLLVAALGALALAGALTAQAPAPARFNAKLETSKGVIVLAVHRDWAPLGADRFYDLVSHGYYDQAKFFRVVKDHWAQTGIAADPAVAQAWRTRTIPDDPVKASNTKGRVSFAFAVPNGRTTQFYISLRDNSSQDAQGFAPFAEVVSGMDVVESLNSEYGETSGGGIRAGHQDAMFEGGNAYLDKNFPRLDFILRATIIAAPAPETPLPVADPSRLPSSARGRATNTRGDR